MTVPYHWVKRLVKNAGHGTVALDPARRAFVVPPAAKPLAFHAKLTGDIRPYGKKEVEGTDRYVYLFRIGYLTCYSPVGR